MRALQKLMLIVGVVSLATALLAVFRPWEFYAWMEFNYVKGHAEEIAEAIELNREARFRRDAGVNQTVIEVRVVLPGEQPLAIRVEYSRIVFPVPVYGHAVLRGKNTTWVREPLVCVVQEGSRIIIDPKPVLNYTRRLEQGRVVHTILILLFRLPYQSLEEDTTIYPSEIVKQVYTRAYSYTGTSEVCINGKQTEAFRVSEGDILEVIVVLHVWDVKS